MTPFLLALLLLLAPSASAAGAPLSFEESHHEGIVEGGGGLAGLKYRGIESGFATLRFDHAAYEQAWQNVSVQSDLAVGGGDPFPERSFDAFEKTTLRLAPNQEDAQLMVFRERETRWDVQAGEGRLVPVEAGTTRLEDPMPLPREEGLLSVPLDGTTVWRTVRDNQTTVTGDFWVSLFGWTALGDDGTTFETGRSARAGTDALGLEAISAAWLHVENATLTLRAEGTIQEAYVHAPTITTVGTTTLVGLAGPGRVFEGTTTLAVTASGERLEGTVTEGTAAAPRPALTALTGPEGSPWLWGGLGAVVFVAAFVFVALAARSAPMLEWRSYHALDRHRPRAAAFWANLWTRRDPWDGHAWSARGEARMMMHHDRGAARDFTKAHALLPPDERAVNALHAARSHARVGHATQAAHWIAIVASHDLNVLLTAREEPDFARVWDHASVQRAVQQVLGVGA